MKGHSRVIGDSTHCPAVTHPKQLLQPRTLPTALHAEPCRQTILVALPSSVHPPSRLSSHLKPTPKPNHSERHPAT